MKFDEKLIERDPSVKYLKKQHKLKENLIFVTYSGKVEGVVEDLQDYTLKLNTQEPEIEKHNILYLYKPEAIEAVAENLKIDEEVAKQNLVEPPPFRKRLNIPYWVRKTFKERKEIKITLRNGHIFSGTVHTHGVFSIRLEIGKDSRVVIMRPNIYDLTYKDDEGTLINVKDIDPSLLKKAKKPKSKAPKEEEVYPEVADYDKINPVPGRMDCSLKINELPKQVRTLQNQWKQFIVVTDGQRVSVTVKPKSWNKITKATEDYESWIAVINGKIGKVENGFELVQPGVQVFERKAKD